MNKPIWKDALLLLAILIFAVPFFGWAYAEKRAAEVKRLKLTADTRTIKADGAYYTLKTVVRCYTVDRIETCKTYTYHEGDR